MPTSIRERGEDLNSVKAVGTLGRRRALGEPDSEQGQPEPGDVGQHVPGVGQEREAAREQSADHLNN
jgi:hypothetical protein